MAKGKQILIVDDDQEIRELLKEYLTRSGFDVLAAAEGGEMYQHLSNNTPDLIILDIMMPGDDGFSLCQQIRRKSQVPIIMLTAASDEADRVIGLELGADDYVTKPFSNRELVARVKANLRRQASPVVAPPEEDDTNEIKIGALIIHEDAYIVSKRGVEIELTHREFELLHYLAKHIGQVMTREHLLQTVWGYDYFGDVRTVDVTVRRLREKIEDTPSRPEYILTRRGVGYYMKNYD